MSKLEKMSDPESNIETYKKYSDSKRKMLAALKARRALKATFESSLKSNTESTFSNWLRWCWWHCHLRDSVPDKNGHQHLNLFDFTIDFLSNSVEFQQQATASSNVISSLFVGRGKSGDFQIRTTLIMSCIFDKIFGALFGGLFEVLSSEFKRRT